MERAEQVVQPAPYRDAARLYWSAGWAGVLPIKGKHPPPPGYTGASGTWPSGADVWAWCEGEQGALNVGLRLPEHVLGIDVDNYGDKPGAGTLGAAVTRWGKLPSTWISTSRDGISGIRLFTVPIGLAWPGELPGGGVEIIRHGHRYAMVWPSLHPEGRTYRWLTPDGAVALNTIPDVHELPALPQAWIDGLTNGALASETTKALVTDRQVAEWLQVHGQGEMCEGMRRAVERAITEIASGGSRHEAAVRGSARLAARVQQGHKGGSAAVWQVWTAFGKATGDPARTAEFTRMLNGAVAMAAQRAVEPFDICDSTNPLTNPYGLASAPRTASAPSAANPFGAPGVPVAVTPEVSHPGSDGATAAVPPRSTDVAPSPVAAPMPDYADLAFGQLVAMQLTQRRARREADRVLDAEERAKLFREPLFVRRLTEELQMPDEPLAYRVAKVMPTGANVLLTAAFKAGKTTLVNNLARALADGVKFLGAFDIGALDGRTVALWNYEVGRSQYRSWLREMKILNTEAVAPLNLRGYQMPITVPDVQDWCVRWLTKHNVAVWIVDPFARAFGGSNENDNTEVNRYLDLLDVIKSRAGVDELVLPTHTGRAVMEEGQERARGATRLDDWADVRWLLTKDEKTGMRYFRATGRDVEYPESLLTFETASRALSISGGDRASTRGDVFRNAVTAVILNTPGIGKVALRESVRVALRTSANKDTDVALADLIAEGKVRQEDAGVGRIKGLFLVTNPFGSAS